MFFSKSDLDEHLSITWKHLILSRRIGVTINVGEANDVITVCPPGSKVQWVLPLMLVYPVLLIERIYSADA